MTDEERAALVDRDRTHHRYVLDIAGPFMAESVLSACIRAQTTTTGVRIVIDGIVANAILADIEPAVRADERARVVEEVTRRLEICAYDHWVLSETDSLELTDRAGHRMCAIAVDTEVSTIRAALTPDPPSNP